MATNTTRLSLKKSESSDTYQTTRINTDNNMDILDHALITNAATTFAAGHGATVVPTNTAIGITALAASTTGINNTAIGYDALKVCTTGTHNTACGLGALGACTTGIYNTALGVKALEVLSYGNYNCAMGRDAGNTITIGSNVSCIGYNAQASGASTTNEIVLGNANIARIRCQVTTITALSDRRDKANIQDSPLGLAFLKTVRPVQFRWAMRPELLDANKKVIGYGPQAEPGRKDIGFISQELDEAETAANVNWLGLAFKGAGRMESNSGKLFPIVVKAIQELAAMVEALQAEVAALKAA